MWLLCTELLLSHSSTILDSQHPAAHSPQEVLAHMLYIPQEGHLFHGQIQSQHVYSSVWRIYKLNSPYPSQSHVLCLPTQFTPLGPLETLWHTHMHPARDLEPWYIKTMQTTPEGTVGWAQIPAETYTEVT
jgi:hypothetical protein